MSFESPQKLDDLSCSGVSRIARTPKMDESRASRFDFAHQVINGSCMRLTSGKLGAGLACVGDDLLATSLGKPPANHFHQVGLLFNRQVFDGVEHFVKRRWLHIDTPVRIIRLAPFT